MAFYVIECAQLPSNGAYAKLASDALRQPVRVRGDRRQGTRTTGCMGRLALVRLQPAHLWLSETHQFSG